MKSTNTTPRMRRLFIVFVIFATTYKDVAYFVTTNVPLTPKR
jgi:hypothetical protein